MRLPVASGERLKRMAKRFGWTPSDASARLVEEGLWRAEFAFIDFRDTAIGRQAYLQGTREFTLDLFDGPAYQGSEPYGHRTSLLAEFWFGPPGLGAKRDD